MLPLNNVLLSDINYYRHKKIRCQSFCLKKRQFNEKNDSSHILCYSIDEHRNRIILKRVALW